MRNQKTKVWEIAAVVHLDALGYSRKEIAAWLGIIGIVKTSGAVGAILYAIEHRPEGHVYNTAKQYGLCKGVRVDLRIWKEVEDLADLESPDSKNQTNLKQSDDIPKDKKLHFNRKIESVRKSRQGWNEWEYQVICYLRNDPFILPFPKIARIMKTIGSHRSIGAIGKAYNRYNGKIPIDLMRFVDHNPMIKNIINFQVPDKPVLARKKPVPIKKKLYTKPFVSTKPSSVSKTPVVEHSGNGYYKVRLSPEQEKKIQLFSKLLNLDKEKALQKIVDAQLDS